MQHGVMLAEAVAPRLHSRAGRAMCDAAAAGAPLPIHRVITGDACRRSRTRLRMSLAASPAASPAAAGWTQTSGPSLRNSVIRKALSN